MSLPNVSILFKCDACNDSGVVYVTHNYADGRVKIVEEGCQDCCEHGDYDHGICGLCGKDCYEALAAYADHMKD